MGQTQSVHHEIIINRPPEEVRASGKSFPLPRYETDFSWLDIPNRTASSS